MTAVTMTSRTTCTLCACRLRGFYVASVRVNKTTLRTTSPGLRFTEPRCPECGFEADSAPGRWALDTESHAAVEAARARRGWAS
ncbi:MAG: hypothetical protein ACR2JO_07940 [Mycobacteriales bacterium]